MEGGIRGTHGACRLLKETDDLNQRGEEDDGTIMRHVQNVTLLFAPGFIL